jgi:hypothetical protein
MGSSVTKSALVVFSKYGYRVECGRLIGGRKPIR